MVNLRTFLGCSFSIIGVVFLTMTVFFIFSKTQTSASNVIYPYRSLALPAAVSGIIFLSSGIIGIWLEYLIFKQRKKVQSKMEIEIDKKRTKITEPLASKKRKQNITESTGQ